MGVGFKGGARLALATLAAGLIAGCGGGEDSLSEAEATAKINALCRESADRSEGITLDPPGQSTEQFVAAYQSKLREYERLQSDLDQLELGGDSQSAADYVAAHGDAVEATKGAVNAIVNSEPGEVTTAQDALEEQSRASDAAVEAADQAGLEDCGPHNSEVAAATSPVGTGTKPRVAAGGNSVIPGSSFVGTWEGTATQIGPDKHQTFSYPVYMRIDPRPKGDGGNGGVRYDSYNCLGRVRIFEAGSSPDGIGYRYKLREKILAGRGDCGSGATITAVTEGDELDWRWKDGPSEATAVLRLREAPKRQPVSEDVIRELQGHEYIGDVTQWGPTGQKGTYQAYYGLYPPGKSPSPGVDGWTLYPDSDPDCTGTLTIESVEGDRATVREHIQAGHCFDNGLIEARTVGNKLLYRWYRRSESGGDERNDVIALGTLSESGPSLGPPPG
ncbi:MAG: hypothetical protein ACRDMH_17130 [Solirubrobacterales bacterium]